MPDLRCDFYELTDVHGGETYGRVPVEPGDIILGDRGYCRPRGLAHVLRRHGDVIVRLHNTSLPLLEPGGDERVQLLSLLRGLDGCQPDEWPVGFDADGCRWHARLCALRKSGAAAEAAKKKLRLAASKKQKRLRPETLEFAEYVMVLVTLDRDTLGTTDVLQLYRARWQIELCFKRFKSLLQLGHLPKRNDESARAWIQAKLLTVLLVERLIEEASLFSPWGFNLAAAQSMA